MYQCVHVRKEEERGGSREKEKGTESKHGGGVEERERKLWIEIERRERERESGWWWKGVEVVEKRSLRKKETEKEGSGRTERAKSDVRRGGSKGVRERERGSRRGLFPVPASGAE